MDVSNMYIPNTAKWIEYYKKNNPQNRISFHHKRKGGQRGRSLVSGANTYITPIEWKTNTNQQKDSSDVPIKIISPSQAVVEQAKTEIGRESHIGRGIKRKQKQKGVSKTNKRRKVKTKKIKKITILKKNKPHKKPTMKTNRKTNKKNSDIFDS